jgi:hypothetical protein
LGNFIYLDFILKFILKLFQNQSGFPLPFFFTGSLLFLLFLISFFLFPDHVSKKEKEKSTSTLPMIPLLLIPRFTLTLALLFCGCMSLNFLEPNIQIQLLPVNY